MKLRHPLLYGLLATSFAVPAAAFAQEHAYTYGETTVYAGPASSYPVITQLPDGMLLTVMHCVEHDSWCDVTWSNLEGWVSADNLSYPSYPSSGADRTDDYGPAHGRGAARSRSHDASSQDNPDTSSAPASSSSASSPASRSGASAPRSRSGSSSPASRSGASAPSSRSGASAPASRSDYSPPPTTNSDTSSSAPASDSSSSAPSPAAPPPSPAAPPPPPPAPEPPPAPHFDAPSPAPAPEPGRR